MKNSNELKIKEDKFGSNDCFEWKISLNWNLEMKNSVELKLRYKKFDLFNTWKRKIWLKNSVQNEKLYSNW